MSYHILEHHNPDEARYGYTPGGYDDPFSVNYIPPPSAAPPAAAPVNVGATKDPIYDPLTNRYYTVDFLGNRTYLPTPYTPTVNVSAGGSPPEDWGPLEYGTVVPGKITQTSSRGNVRVVGDNGPAAPSAGTVSYKTVNGRTYAITVHPDGNITSQEVPGLPAEEAGAAGAPALVGNATSGYFVWDDASKSYKPAPGLPGGTAANPYNPANGAQGMAGGSSGGDGGLTRQLASIASAAAKAEAEANRAFQREQLAAQQARDAAQNAIAQGNLDLARQQFAASERHAAEAERIRVTELRGTLASQVANQVSSVDPLGYSTFLDAYAGGGTGPFTNALAQGQNAVTDAANTPAALTLQALAELNNPSGTQTGTGQQTFNNPSGQSTGGSRFGGLSGLVGNQRGRGNVQSPRDYSQPSTPVSNVGQFQVEDPNRPGVMLSLTRGQLNDLIYATTHPGPNPQTGARINDTTSISGLNFANGQSSYVDNAGTFVGRTGPKGVPLDSTYTNGGETLTPAAQAGLNQIDPATGLMKMAQGGLTNARMFMAGDAQHRNPWQGGAQPEIVRNPTGAPIEVIPSPQTQSIATGVQAFENPPLTAVTQTQSGGNPFVGMGGLSGLFANRQGQQPPPGMGRPMPFQQRFGARPMDAMQYRQQYRPRPEPVRMPRFAYGTSAFKAPKWNTGRPAATAPSAPPAPGPSGPITTQPVTGTPTTGTTAPQNSGIGGLTGITPQQSYLDQVAAYRANAQGPDLNFFDVGYDLLDPTYRDVGLMKLQGKFGIPVASAQALQQRYALAGGPSYGGY